MPPKVDKDLSRWQRHKHLEMTPEAIATEDKVDVKKVRASIQRVELRKRLNTMSEMESGQIEVIQHVAEFEKIALTDALTATKTVKKDGKDVEVPDQDVRMMAVKRVTEKAAAIQPRLKGATNVNVNVAQNQQQQALGAGARKSLGFEDVLRQIKAKQNNPQLTSGDDVIDAEVLPAAPEQEVILEG